MFRLYVILLLITLSTTIHANSLYIAHLKTVEGKVSIVRGDNVLTAKAGARLYEGDILKTDIEAEAAIIFVDGTLLSCGSESDLVMTKYLYQPRVNKYAFNIRMKKGSAIYTSGTIAKRAPESVKILTPEATIGVRGTKILVKVD